MTKKTAISIVLSAIVATQSLAAAESRQLLGRDYVRSDQGWQMVTETGETFEVNPRVITVKFRPGASRGAERALHEAMGTTELRRARTGFIDIEIPEGRDVFAVLDDYLASDTVEIAEPNTFGRYLLTPNDPDYGVQWHLPQVDAEAVWDVNTGAPSAIVAVLDSGTEFAHSDLGMGTDGYQNVWINTGEDAWTTPNDPTTGNGVDDDNNGYIDDYKGYNFDNNSNNGSGPFFHGTAVAGVVAAKTNNGLGVAGIAGGNNNAGASVMIGGVGNNAPNGAVLDDAILYAAENGAQVVQLSLSVGPSAAIDAAFQMAHDMYGVTSICASGNGGGTSVSYPSSNTNVIAVGATNQSDLRANFSQHGPLVEVSAPGTTIRTLNLNNGYTTSDGTSFAAPLVSGVVALMLTANPSLTNVQIRQILHDTADKVGGYDYNWNMSMPGHSFELGYGRVNANAAVAASGGGGIFSDGFESGDTSVWSSTAP